MRKPHAGAMNKKKYLQDVTRDKIIGTETYVFYKNKVLMHKRAKEKRFPNYWTGPGGHVDEDEDVLKAAIREVKEETGVIVKKKDIQLKSIAFHYHVDRKELYLIFIYRAHISSLKTIKNNEREGRSEWIDKDKLISLQGVFPPSKFYFDHVLENRDGILYTNIHWKDSKLYKMVSRSVDSDG